MDEIIRGMAEHREGVVNWHFVADGLAPLEIDATGIYDAVDEFVLDNPAYRVMILIEREEGTERIPDTPALLIGRGTGKVPPVTPTDEG